VESPTGWDGEGRGSLKGAGEKIDGDHPLVSDEVLNMIEKGGHAKEGATRWCRRNGT